MLIKIRRKLFDTGFCVDGATLRPPITYHGDWKDISDDDEVNVPSKTTVRNIQSLLKLFLAHLTCSET